jgi:uncharacterized membrane protein
VRLARLTVTFLATIWVVLLATAPAAALGAPLAGLTYAFGSLLCHQRPDRSFHLGLSQLPVCARCVGLYLGAAAGALGLIIRSRVVQRDFTAWSRTDVRRMLVAGALPTAITWALEAAGLWAPSNVTRFIAALPLGVAVALTVNYVECARPQRSESRLPPTPI